jgi:molybdopterin-guanine dinucleotide biosynthesis protein A
MGRPKSHLTLAGRPVLHYLHRRFAWPGPTLLITAPGNQHPPGHDLFDAEATDPVPDEGPLRGVLTALEHATTPVVAVTTVDMPGVTAAQFRWLSERLQGLAVMCSCGTVDEKGRVEPFPSVFDVARAKEVVSRRLARGQRSVQALRDEPGVSVFPAPAAWPAEVWANLNHPADLDAFEQDARP